MSLKIALFHPWIKSKGGAEKVVLDISNIDGLDVDIYTWTFDSKNTFEEFKNKKIYVLASKFMNYFSKFKIFRGIFLISSFFSKIPLDKYDYFLISTAGVGEFITFRNYKKGKTFAYVHTPLRDASKDIIQWNMKNLHHNFISRFFYWFAIQVYNFFEYFAWKRLDFVIFNSKLSASRAEEKGLINKKKNKIIYPPIEIKRFNNNSKNKKYFLYVSRFNKNKRQDVLIKAWKSFFMKNKDYKLIFVGGKEDNQYYNDLKEMSKNMNVEIYTNVSNKELNEFIENCHTGIFLGYREDFGIVPFEYLSAKKQTILSMEGGYYDLLKNSKNIIFVRDEHIESDLLNALISMTGKNYTEENQNYLQEVDTKKFKEKIKKVFR